MSLYHPVKIGNLELAGNLFLAPVAGYTDRAFRSLCAEAGANFSYTELVSAEALVRGNNASVEMMQAAPSEKNYAVQIFGSNPETIARAVKIVLEKTTCSCIDINCGCPVPKVVKTGAGAALTRDADRLYEVAKAAVDAVASFAGEGAAGLCADVKRLVPVTVKIRSGWDSEHITWREAADAAISAGVAAITMHPRTRAQGYEGKSDWKQLRSLVEFVEGRMLQVNANSQGAVRDTGSAHDTGSVGKSGSAHDAGSQKVAVFGSGDLFTPEDARAMLEETKCDGVMFARGAMGNPFIFNQTRALLTTGIYAQPDENVRIETGLRELDLLVAEIGEARACREMRKRFCSYTKGMSGGAAVRAKLVHAETVADYKTILGSV